MPSRHSLVWLTAAGWQSALKQASTDAREVIEKWHAADFPAVARQHEVDCPADLCCIGIAAPPDSVTGHKTRLPLRIARDHIRAVHLPATLTAILPALPPSWHVALGALDDALCAQGVKAQVFGSAALQATTGLAYLHRASDIDLLFHPASPSQLAGMLKTLTQFKRTPRLDGEIIFPGGAAVAWKEWRQATRQSASARVLVKQHGGVSLKRADALMASLENLACTT